jgi:hypothetical protein
VAFGSSDYGWWAGLLGDPPIALAACRRAVEIAEKLGGQMTRVYAYNALGVAELSAGRAREAVTALEQALGIAREMRTGGEVGLLTLAHLADAQLARGDPARARELAEQAVSEACRHRVLASECFAQLVHARVLLSREDVGAAGALQRALALVEETGARCYAPFVRVERARLARLSGNTAEWAHEMRLAHQLFTEMGATGRAEAVARELGR